MRIDLGVRRVPAAMLTALLLVPMPSVDMSAAAAAAPQDQQEDPPGRNGARPDFVEQEVLVAFEPGTPAATRARVRRRHQVTHVEDLPLPGLERVRMRGRGGPPERANRMARERAVRYAQPNHTWSVDSHDDGNEPPNDPGFSELWGLYNDGQTGGTLGADIDYLQAWTVVPSSRSVVVGIIDSGVAIDHPDLAANIWLNTGELPLPRRSGPSECRRYDCDRDGVVNYLDYVDDPRIDSGCLVRGAVLPSSLLCAFEDGQDSDGNGLVDDIVGWDFQDDDNEPDDLNSHGTHVAGTAAAVANNGIGVAGSSQARIMPLKFLDSEGFGTTADAVKALDYAIQMGAHLTNNSWGGGGADAALSEKILEADAEGQLFVAAAGNDGTDIDRPTRQHYPASFNHPNMLTVAATNNTDGLASFSNFGAETVHLGAPGSSIYSTVPGSTGYGLMSGTSMAAPHVAGVAADVFGAYPGLGHGQVRDRVIERGDAISSLDGVTVSGRRLNLAGALDSPGAPLPAGLSVTPTPFALGESGDAVVAWSLEEPAFVTLQISADGGGSPLRTEVLGAQSAGGHTWAWNGADDSGSDVVSGDYVVEVAATDVAGQMMTSEVAVEVQAGHEADLRAWVGHSSDPVAPGEELTYDLRVRNFGPSRAARVATRAVVASALTEVFLSGPASADCSYAPRNHTVTCDFGDLAPEGVRRLLVTGVVPAPTSAEWISLSYEAVSPTHDPSPERRSFTRITTVLSS